MTDLTTICANGPFALTAKLYLVKASVDPDTEDGFEIIVAAWDFGPGSLPGPQQVEAALVSAKTSVEQAIGCPCKYLTRHQFAQHVLAERSGSDQRWAIPGPDIFTLDVPGLIN